MDSALSAGRESKHMQIKASVWLANLEPLGRTARASSAQMAQSHQTLSNRVRHVRLDGLGLTVFVP